MVAPKTYDMAKSKKKSTSAKPGKEPHSPNAPRLNGDARRLHLLYEPLVLMHTLGNVREEHTGSETYSHLKVPQLPPKEVRRVFLDELAYMCDYDKGGDTVTAIGLERTPQGCVYWVAANTCPKRKIVPFLQGLLQRLKATAREENGSSCSTEESLANESLEFASARLKKYRSLLKVPLSRCIDIWKGANGTRSDLLHWLKTFQNPDQELAVLCSRAYEERHSTHMEQVVKLSVGPSYKSSQDAVHRDFQSVRHYIGRPGHHFRASRILMRCARRVIHLLDEFEIKSITTPLRAPGLPPTDGKTRLDSIIRRMLPSEAADNAREYQKALADMDPLVDLSDRFLSTYQNPSLKPRVHAEVLVLQQFYENGLAFEEGDRYIACSKPACYCCSSYFRHHPGLFEQPRSHNKVYLNWRPPGFDLEPQSQKWKEQRDILFKMRDDIRREVLHQILEKRPRHSFHPDSITGITESIVMKQDLHASLKDSDSSSERSGRIDLIFIVENAADKESEAAVHSSPESLGYSSPADNGTYITAFRPEEHQKLASSGPKYYPTYDSDSDSEGGVLVSSYD